MGWAVLAVGCSGNQATTACPAALAAHPTDAPWTAAVDDAGPVATTFTLTIDPKNAALASTWRQPQAAPLTATGGGDASLRLVGGVKAFATHASRLYLELYLVNDAARGLGDVTLQPSALSSTATAFYDLTVDPLSAPVAAAADGALPLVAVGGIGPEGVSSRLRLAVDADGSGAPITLQLALAATTTARVATTSAPLAITPDGAEVWAAVPDADRVSVVATADDTRRDSVAVAGHPSSVALTPDGMLALVACPTCNQLVVIDRASRKPVQVFGEPEGIGREPRQVVVAPDGTRAYVSAYVGDRVTILERRGDRFAVVGQVPLGRRPLGMSLPPDGKTLYVAHFLPHGPIEDNGGWVSIVDPDAAAEVTTAELRDDGDVKEAGCLSMVAAFAGASGEDLSFEATPTQLAGVFLAPGGGEAWVPALRVAGFPILEGNVAPLGLQFATLGANS
ncbi:MAG TPA: YncE family protein, partial [Polyangia bacterium]|nr:YncE family protein [Polyangia bacterium]